MNLYCQKHKLESLIKEPMLFKNFLHPTWMRFLSPNKSTDTSGDIITVKRYLLNFHRSGTTLLKEKQSHISLILHKVQNNRFFNFL